MTPSILPNWASEPQNQPRAKAAVSTEAGISVSIRGFSPLGAGRLVAGLLQPVTIIIKVAIPISQKNTDFPDISPTPHTAT
jgi:hypothetical protein